MTEPTKVAVLGGGVGGITAAFELTATPELRERFDDSGRIAAWLDILAALAEAQAELGLVPEEAARAIRSGARVELLDLERVGAETRASGHSTLGLIRCLR